MGKIIQDLEERILYHPAQAQTPSQTISSLKPPYTKRQYFVEYSRFLGNGSLTFGPPPDEVWKIIAISVLMRDVATVASNLIITLYWPAVGDASTFREVASFTTTIGTQYSFQWSPGFNDTKIPRGANREIQLLGFFDDMELQAGGAFNITWQPQENASLVSIIRMIYQKYKVADTYD